MIRHIVVYGFALAAGSFGLQILEYQLWARTHPVAIYVALVATAFLALGIWLGARLFRREPRTEPFAPNARAQVSLGITDREREVLQLLAAGRSNKEIARRLGLSPNTVKTHVARLFGKLQAARRTEAVGLARELGIVP
jgi:DNA-binding CsgD family transcriptional regulator